MSSIFRQVFGCCIRERSTSPLDGSLNEHSRLIPATNDAPTTIPDVIVVDHQKLKERLGTIVRAKEGKMVNVNAQIPFNLHNQSLTPRLDHPSSSRSASNPHNPSRQTSRRPSPSPQPSLQTDHSTSSLHRGEDFSSSTYLPSSEANDSADGLLRNPILNVRLVRGVGHLTRSRRGRARGRSRRWDEGDGQESVLANGIGVSEEEESPNHGEHETSDGRMGNPDDGVIELPPQEQAVSELRGDDDLYTKNSDELGAAPTFASDFKIHDAGHISRSWGD